MPSDKISHHHLYAGLMIFDSAKFTNGLIFNRWSFYEQCLGSASKASIIYAHAPVAQWTECLTSNQSVARSSRAGGTLYTQIPTNFLGKDKSVSYAFPPTEDRRVAPGAYFLPKFLRIPLERLDRSVTRFPLRRTGESRRDKTIFSKIHVVSNINFLGI